MRDWRATPLGRRAVYALVVFLAAGGLAGALERTGSGRVPRERALEELAYYPNGAWLRAMSLGEGALWADVTWLRAVQYYGERRQIDNTFRLLYHAFDVVTNFDTRHLPSYIFSGPELLDLCQGGQLRRLVRMTASSRFAAHVFPPFAIPAGRAREGAPHAVANVAPAAPAPEQDIEQTT